MNLDFIDRVEKTYLRRPLLVVIAILYVFVFVLVAILETLKDIIIFAYNFLKAYLPKLKNMFIEDVYEWIRVKW